MADAIAPIIKFDPSRVTREEYKRYGRQMILPGWGLPGQLALKKARVAVVGAGGLGCPVLQYLAGAGVGTIDVHDHDEVSASNLHRQVLHTNQGARERWGKADSAASAMRALNPYIIVNPNASPILPHTALTQLAPANIIVDCTDRPLTRYLLSDAAVRLGVPLVSGAAISDLGQWAVYGGLKPVEPSTEAGPSNSGRSDQARPKEDRRARACYRCIWPKPLPGSSGRCEDVGVWGMVTGMVGTGMATEVVKLLLGKADAQPMLQTLHLTSAPMVRSTRLRPARPDCPSCGPNATIGLSVDTATGERKADLSQVDYVAFCAGAGGDGDDWADYQEDGEGGDKMTRSGMMGKGERIGVGELQRMLDAQAPTVDGQQGREVEHDQQTATRGVRLIDTRSATEFGICAIPGSINIPLSKILKDPLSALAPTHRPKSDAPPPNQTQHDLNAAEPSRGQMDMIFVCKLGNDSQLAAEAVRAALSSTDGPLNPISSGDQTSDTSQGAAVDAVWDDAPRVMDVRGGLRAWGKDVDPDFPLYF